jgi:hypothetical protein
MVTYRKMFALRLPPDLIEEMDAWCKAQRPPVTKTALVEMVIRDFLIARRATPSPDKPRSG